MIGAIGEGTLLREGRYSLQARVGSGGAATVWLADDDVLDRPVAVKVLSEALASDDSWLARFRREARLAASLTHPNLVSVYDFDASEERPYIVMAYMPGGSLWDRLQIGEPSDPERLARDLLTALEAIHAAGIVHRDIKPGNVLFDAAGTACLTDFGVARPEDATSLTQTGQIPGTARFMAPELWAGEPADERTDLYSAGVVLREAIGNDGAPQTRALVDRLCAEDASDRPESASAALRDLDGMAEPAPLAPAGEPTPRTTVVQAERRSARPAAIAGVALLAVVAIVAIAQAIGSGDEEGGTNTAAERSASKDDGAKQPDSGGSRDSGSGAQGAGDRGSSGSATATATAVDPVALDQEGKALIDAGRPEEAIPILQQAVDYYPKDSRDINYAYSLYNLGHALLLAGRPDEAIPYLEKRLTWDDQVDTVQQTLDEAYAAAGEGSETEDDSDAKPGGKVPPGQAKKDG